MGMGIPMACHVSSKKRHIVFGGSENGISIYEYTPKACFNGVQFFQTNHQSDPADSHRGTHCLPVVLLPPDGSPNWST